MLQASAALRARDERDEDVWSNKNPGPSHNTQKEREARKLAVRKLALHCNGYKGSIPSRAVTQILTTGVPFVALVAAMFAFVDTHYWLTLLLGIPAGGLLVRFFIIQHDCGHGSFWPTRTANDWTGRLMSLLTLAPYGLWRREHAQHHATSGNLEKRGVGDINTLTVREYQALPVHQRLVYRLYRHPLFLFGLGVPFYFLVLQRLPWFHPYPARETWKSVMGLNAGLLAVYGPLGYLVGYGELALVAWPMLHVATAAGGWLFFIQHQFEDTEWHEGDEWSFQESAVHGSSYYALPPVLDWFTGNIGLHHIHHLNSTIPNYRLQECLAASPDFQTINKLTLRDSLKCAQLKLWDEDRKELVGFDGIAAARA